ncbi:phage tail sheath subtilisin-like domain-containing protein [Micromonospora sp. NPDC005305]|uniref:phage tail sheath subtilisin-like domain-containing protein n=1 Tax=Micromonospora sp. NPDC005305 TaxID=3156875 RepID=UPI0033BEE1FB
MDIAGVAGGAPPFALGAPGVYFASAARAPRLVVEPMDEVAFVGVAPRGPAWEPVDDPTLVEAGVAYARSVAVAVDSWDGYLERFGGFEGEGLLPHAVATFFAQGGRRAHIVRIVHRGPDRPNVGRPPPGCARLQLSSPVCVTGGAPLALRARNEGSWGNRLVVRLTFPSRPVHAQPLTESTLRLDPGGSLPAGALLRIRSAGRVAVAFVSALRRVGRRGDPRHDLVAVLDRPVVMAGPAVVELVTAQLLVTDEDPARLRQEHFPGLGLHPAHPRFLPDVVRRESRLVDVLGDDGGQVELVDPAATEVVARGYCGADRWHLITPEDFFGRLTDGDDTGVEGLDCLLGAPGAATVVVPDLYRAERLPPAPPAPATAPDPQFRPCRPATPSRATGSAPGPGLASLRLDPTAPKVLERIVALQQRLVAVAERLNLVALLDVPPGLLARQVLAWRSSFDSSHAAAYHPWLRAPADEPAPAGAQRVAGRPVRRDPTGPLLLLPPSAVAAGIIARCELRQGVSRGPANEPAFGVVDVAERVDGERHTELHGLGVNVFLPEPDGVRLTGCRTLATDRAWRQLTARRLLLLIERVVRRQLQWTVFEPDGTQLRAGLQRQLDQLLADLSAEGAFAGATPETSWFVHVASGPGVGRVVVEVGVAPSEPAEFIVVRVAINAEGATETSLSVGPGVIRHG